MTLLPQFRTVIKALTALISLTATLTLTASGQNNPQPASSPTESPAPKSTVKGRVIYDDTNRPVRRSPVSLIQLPERGRLSSATDGDGRFVIAEVPAGVYFALVDSPGIITPISFMKLSDKGPPESWNVKDIKAYCTEIVVDGSTNVEVTIRAHRGGALSGKVTYHDGDPAVNAEVGVLRRKGPRSERVLVGANPAALLSLHTDDRGRYRIAGLPPGEYIISAAETNTALDKSGRYRSDAFSEFFKSDALIVSYYGGTIRLADAIAVQVEEGSELNNLDIALPDATPHALSGSVVAKLDGRVLPGASLTIRSKDQSDWFLHGSRQIETDSQGQWTLDGVPDGSYLVSVEPYEIPLPGAVTQIPGDDDESVKTQRQPTRKFVRKEMEITVAGSDVAGVMIELADGASISGVVEMPAENSDPAKGYAVMVRYTYEGEASVDYGNATGASDGNFTIESLRAGKIYLSADVGIRYDEAKKYYVKSITLNGHDLMQKPLTISAGQAIKNVRIVVASDLARTMIQLIDPQGKPVPGKPVVIVPVDQSRWAFSNDKTRCVTDIKGTLPFAGAPGEYLVFVAGADDSWPPSLDAIRTRAATAQRINLHPGENKTVTVTLIP